MPRPPPSIEVRHRAIDEVRSDEPVARHQTSGHTDDAREHREVRPTRKRAHLTTEAAGSTRKVCSRAVSVSTTAKHPAASSRPVLAICLLGLCLVAIACGVYIRVQALDFPRLLTSDEHHFVRNARNYLTSKPDWNDHPPLGKLMMALVMKWLGDDPRSWRLCAVGFGLSNIALAFALAARAFRSREAGLCAAAFVAIDGFLIVYSRTALLDGILTAFGLGAVLVLAFESTRMRSVLAGVLIGCAMSIKLSGVTLLAPLAVALLLGRASMREKLLHGALALLAALLVYDAQYALGLTLSGLPGKPRDVLAASVGLIKHHAALTEMAHPMTSHWYTWWLPTRPMLLRFDRVNTADGQLIRAMFTLGNPLLWWSSALVTLATALLLVRDTARTAWLALTQRSASLIGTLTLDPDTRAACLLMAAFAGFLSPWVLTGRDSYLYHYLPCYAFALVMLAGAASRLYARNPIVLLSALALAMGVSVFFAPIWGQFPITDQGYQMRLFLEMWRR